MIRQPFDTGPAVFKYRKNSKGGRQAALFLSAILFSFLITGTTIAFL
jgi:hypothetical protein